MAHHRNDTQAENTAKCGGKTAAGFLRALFVRLHTNPWTHKIGKSLCITCVALLLSMVLASPFAATTATLFSSPEQSDFRFSDIFAQVADSRPVSQIDDNIVILNVGNAKRDEIAEALTVLSLCSPKAVGVDILFAEAHEDDTDLIYAITSLPDVVLPVVMAPDSVQAGGRKTFHVSEHTFLRDIENPPAAIYAACNFPTSGLGRKGRVRRYAFSFPTAGGDSVPSFPMALARLADPEAASRAEARRAELGTIDYPSRVFEIITPAQLIDSPETVVGKIVMVGTLNDAEDMHATPVNSYQPGVVIHAHSLATILDGTWFRYAPGYLDKLVASIVCFLLVIVCISTFVSYRGLTLRALQVLLLYLAVRVGYTLYVENHIILDFSYTLLMIAFGLFACDLYNGLRALSVKIYSKYKTKPSPSASTPCEELS